MDKILKAINCEIKSINEEERSFTAVASTEDIDRDGDRIMASGWDVENFIKNPVIPWGHNYAEPPVAKAVEIGVQDGKLMFKPKFPTAEEYPFADTIWKLYKGGFLNAFSVGFMPRRWEYVERGKGMRGRDYHEQELWEISACTVPSNPNALVAAKSAGVITEEEAAALEPEKRGIGESGNEIPEILAQIERINKCLDILGSNIDTLLKERQKPEHADGSTPSESPADPGSEFRVPSSAFEKPLTQESVKAAFDAALATLDTRIKSVVGKEIKYHLGIIN